MLLTILLILSQSLLAFNKSENDLQAQLTKYDAQRNAHGVELSQLTKQIDALKKEQAALEKQTQKTKVSSSQVLGGRFVPARYEWLPSEETIAKVEAVKNQIAELEKKATSTKEQISASVQNAMVITQKKEENEVESLNQALRALSLESKMSDILNGIYNQDRAIDAVANKYDQALVGSYVKEKIGKLLNSNAFCKAKEACGKDQAITPQDLEELFPNTVKGSADRYKKTRSGTR